ncbi:MAG: hypothetical protein AAF493_28980, partial [Pseudomonadota bacterium]
MSTPTIKYADHQVRRIAGQKNDRGVRQYFVNLAARGLKHGVGVEYNTDKKNVAQPADVYDEKMVIGADTLLQN